jgi:aspartyl-tRNA(Asn)/glutamyl-tRNA(Gln) amidotransferase subunit B
MAISYDDVVAKYDPVLGLEVHVELNTESKMFCSCSTVFGGEPNTQTCPVCLALPGALPVVNARAIESTIKIGLALNCSIAPYSRFARKNYFYPDMPKNFQISQYDEPICFDGYVDVEIETDEGPKEFRIEVERVHMEEDTGKSLHVGGATGRIHGADYSLLDYNRAGIPLVEIVTKIVPGTGKYAPEVARAYVAELRDILRGLGVSDVKMEQGSLRCDANVSLKPMGSDVLGTRSETKNVNSLRSVERAIRGEMIRHAELLDAGKKVKQETRHFQEDTGLTRSGRSKEQAEDYRYFPEPDLVPVAPDAAWIEELRKALPERPSLRRKRLKQEWNVPDKEMAAMLTFSISWKQLFCSVLIQLRRVHGGLVKFLELPTIKKFLSQNLRLHLQMLQRLLLLLIKVNSPTNSHAKLLKASLRGRELRRRLWQSAESRLLMMMAHSWRRLKKSVLNKLRLLRKFGMGIFLQLAL